MASNTPIGRDYRQSHEDKGPSYDGQLSNDPLDSYLAGREAVLVERWVRKLYPSRVGRYLDFACGTGRLAAVVGPLARETVGVDVSETMLAEARRKLPGCTFINADLTRADAPVELFDLATAFRFFGNAQDELRESALRTLHRSLRPGGYLILDNHRNPYTLQRLGRGLLFREAIISTPEWSRADLHFWKLRRLLATCGFEIKRVQGIAWWLVMARLGRPRVFESRLTSLLEHAGRLAPLAALSPDVVILARRV